MAMDFLGDQLKERTRVVRRSNRNNGEFVLYWMRSAIRSDENPALAVAQRWAVESDAPLLVYQGLSDHYEFASDRHHTFILEGARDVQQQFAELGIRYAFHISNLHDRRRHLIDLANRSLLVITEEMPVNPPRRFLKTVLRSTDATVVCVDTACVVPMQLVGRPYTRAFQFRQKTKSLYAGRIATGLPTDVVEAKNYECDLPFEPVDLQTTELGNLISLCDIDHAVAPVRETRGGSEAGYARWNRFKESSLLQYALQRNDALIDGVSRMSAYLHYGMVSPMRLAREAAGIDHPGAEKYLDELLIWRELAYGFCFYNDDYGEWSSIPNWAQATLKAHETDPRGTVYSWEELARAQTDDALWNAAQISLLKHGELHNNVRMTWGKAILNWVKTPREALPIIIDLNHRYALDGRDPSSYGGILWCLGQFDRPFEPERKIFGTLRNRSTIDHARRLDPEKYLKKVNRPAFDENIRVAVIGAGISGLIAARTLVDHGVATTIFEKSRGPGGRMATRRVDGIQRFDHGAQYFTVRNDGFRRYVDSWVDQGIVAKWPNQKPIVVLEAGKIKERKRSSERWVAVPGMNSICKHLAKGLAIQSETRVEKVEAGHERLRLWSRNEKELGEFDFLVVSAPATQTAELLAGQTPIYDSISKIEMNRCMALMVSFDRIDNHEWSGAFVEDSLISWISRNDSKPGRPNGNADFVIHSRHEFAVENWDEDPFAIGKKVLTEFWSVTGWVPAATCHQEVHRWKYSQTVQPRRLTSTFDQINRIAVCGDWTLGDRVEGAFLSGINAAGWVLRQMDGPVETPTDIGQRTLF